MPKQQVTGLKSAKFQKNVLSKVYHIWRANSVDPDEVVHYGLPLGICYLEIQPLLPFFGALSDNCPKYGYTTSQRFESEIVNLLFATKLEQQKKELDGKGFI